MKAPYFEVIADCRNPNCDRGLFRRERKKVVRIGSDGRPYTTQNLVCPDCKQWANVVKIKEIPVNQEIQRTESR